jgi:hypothetical protein
LWLSTRKQRLAAFTLLLLVTLLVRSSANMATIRAQGFESSQYSSGTQNDYDLPHTHRESTVVEPMTAVTMMATGGFYRFLGFPPFVVVGAAKISRCYQTRADAELAVAGAKVRNPGWTYLVERVDAEGRAS